MRKKQILFFYNYNIRPDEIQNIQVAEFKKIINDLDGVTVKNDTIEFYPMTINNDKNEKYITNKYDYLRNVFDLKPYKQLPKKKISSLLVRLLKIQGYEIQNSRKYYRDKSKISTQGFYIAKSTSL
jgi:hypothetical protein